MTDRRLREFGRALRIGQRFRRRDTREVVVVRQVHRADRVVEIVYDPALRTLGFQDLRDKFESVGGAS